MRSEKKMRDDFRQMCIDHGTYSAKLEPAIANAATLQHLFEQMREEMSKRTLMIETVGSAGQPIIKQHPHVEQMIKCGGKIQGYLRLMGLCNSEAPTEEYIDPLTKFLNELQ